MNAEAKKSQLHNVRLFSLRSWHVACPQEQRVSAFMQWDERLDREDRAQNGRKRPFPPESIDYIPRTSTRTQWQRVRLDRSG